VFRRAYAAMACRECCGSWHSYHKIGATSISSAGGRGGCEPKVVVSTGRASFCLPIAVSYAGEAIWRMRGRRAVW